MRARVVPLVCALALSPLSLVPASGARADSVESAVPRATCGPGSAPEHGLQGQVPLADRTSGRSKQGYTCNLELLGRYQGQGTSVVNQSYRTCAYNSTTLFGAAANPSPGVQVIDASNPRKPRLAGTLTSPAMATDTWESLKVNEAPAHPSIAAVTAIGLANHGFELSLVGNRLYLTTAAPSGVVVFDVSEVQARAAIPQIRQLGQVQWGGPASVGQHTIPVTWGGKPYLVAADEFAGEDIHIIDISDETKPTVVRRLQLEISRPENADVAAADVAGNGLFGYDAHYCTVDRRTDPTALACGFFQSGVRIFDISDPLDPREIAYFNPPAQTGRNAYLAGSWHANHPDAYTHNVSGIRDTGSGVLVDTGKTPDLSAGWCSSPPRFVGTDELWVSCMDNGFLALRFTNKGVPEIVRSPGVRRAAFATGAGRAAVAALASFVVLGLGVAVGAAMEDGSASAGSAAAAAPNAVDIGFSQDMVVRHEQAVLMAQLVRSRTKDPKVAALAAGIEDNQLLDIGAMRGYLALWAAPVLPTGPPMTWMADESHHEMGPGGMPGMATSAELNALQRAKGDALDRMFLTLMLRHHEGGQAMLTDAGAYAAVPAVQSLANRIAFHQREETQTIVALLRARGIESGQ